MMTTIQPQGEDLRKAVKWISEERRYGPQKKLFQLIEEACLRFNLSAADEEYLVKLLKEEQ